MIEIGSAAVWQLCCSVGPGLIVVSKVVSEEDTEYTVLRLRAPAIFRFFVGVTSNYCCAKHKQAAHIRKIVRKLHSSSINERQHHPTRE